MGNRLQASAILGPVARLVVERLLDLVSLNEMRAFLAVGITESRAFQLKSLTVTRWRLLIGQADTFVTVSVDPAKLEEALDRVDRFEADERRIQDCVERSAPTPMLNYLFGLTKDQVAAWRQVLGVSGIGGRPTDVGPEAAQRLRNAWVETNDLTNEAERYLAIADKTGFDLRVVWQELRPVAPEAEPARKRRSSANVR